MQVPIFVGGTEVQPGSRQTVDFPLAQLYTHTEMTMPVHVIHGRKEGPCLFVCAAIHGDEINGVEIIRRLLGMKVTRQIKGTLIAIPIVNVFGFIHRSRFFPDRRDLNRSFPGSEQGSLPARMAKLIMDEIIAHCTHGIDLHTGSSHRSNLPHVRAVLEDPETYRLARAFGAPVIIDSNYRDGSLREAVAERGIPMLLYEAGEALRFSEMAIQTGLRGILSVMRHIGMLQMRPNKKKMLEPAVARSTTWVRAPKSGILSSKLRIGDWVKKGENLGMVSDPFGGHEEPIICPTDGIIIGNLNMPLVYQGDAMLHIAAVSSDLREALTAIDWLREEDFEAGGEF